MGMRTAKLLGLVSLVLVAVAATGCGYVSTQSNGAWTACGNVMRPSVVQVRRTASLSGGEALSVTERRAAVVRRLYFDMCVIAGHPYHFQPGEAISCPDDFGLTYRGAFYDRKTKIAVFSYAASGCESLSLSVGLNQSTSQIFGKVALAVQPSLDAGLAAALGIPANAIHQRSS
jgi:hypothetical protein